MRERRREFGRRTGSPSSDGRTEVVTQVDRTTVYSSRSRDVLQDGYNRIRDDIIYVSML